MNSSRKNLIIAILIPLAAGSLSSLLSRGGFQLFNMLNKPPLAPPAILFPVVWTILFILMGIASYLVYEKGSHSKALTLYAIQLFFNFFWSIWFFYYGCFLFAFIWLLCLWGLILATIIAFYPISKTAAYLLVPYLVWVTFAGYLNLAIYLINRS